VSDINIATTGDIFPDDDVASAVEDLAAALGDTPMGTHLARAGARLTMSNEVGIDGFSQNFDVTYIHELTDRCEQAENIETAGALYAE
jgi:hypothetical protein